MGAFNDAWNVGTHGAHGITEVTEVTGAENFRKSVKKSGTKQRTSRTKPLPVTQKFAVTVANM